MSWAWGRPRADGSSFILEPCDGRGAGSGWGGVGDLVGVDLVGDAGWRGVVVEVPDFLPDLFVGGGDALAGAEVVEPGLHDEGLVEMFGIGGVAVDAPADGAVAEADVAELMDGVGEGGVVGEGDAELDGDADGAGECGVVGGVGGGEGSELRGGALPLIGSVVGERALEDVEAVDEGKGDEQAAGGGGECGGGGGVFGDEAPEDGAEGHAALEGHEVGAEGAGLDPGGDGELDGGVEGGHGAGPGGAGEDEHGHDDVGAADEGEDEQGKDVVEGRDGDDAVGGDAAAEAG